MQTGSAQRRNCVSNHGPIVDELWNKTVPKVCVDDSAHAPGTLSKESIQVLALLLATRGKDYRAIAPKSWGRTAISQIQSGMMLELGF